MKYIILIYGLLAGCNASAEPDPYIKIVGQISQDTVLMVKNAPRAVSKIIITSQGGDTASAIEIGRMIRSRNYNLVIRKYCLSACAQWLMPSSKDVVLENMPVIGMHHTATAFYEILLASGQSLEAQKYAEISALEKAFYREMDVDEAMLTYPYSQAAPICYILSQRTGSKFAKVASKWGFVALSLNSYRKFTGNLPTGRWAETESEIRKFGKKYIPSQANISFIQEGQSLALQEPGKTLSLPSCSDRQRKEVGID